MRRTAHRRRRIRRVTSNRIGRIVRRRLSAAVDDEDGCKAEGREAAERTKAKPAFVKFAKLIAEVIRENGRETNRRASKAQVQQDGLNKMIVHGLRV